MEKVLNVPCHYVTIAGTSLVGVFITGNDNKILVPRITDERELRESRELILTLQ